MVFSGLDHLLEHPETAPGGRIGLITNHSAVTHDLRPGVDALREAGLNITVLFGPEHGIRGDAAAGAHVESGIDLRSGLPVHSLYGPNRKPSSEMLRDVDALIFDLQDVGTRFYTFLYTMAYCMEAAGEAGIPIVVLDRPNPLGGLVVEGPLVQEGYTSFVGKYPIPIRYGLTIGELALYFQRELGIACDLHVTPITGWSRATTWEETGRAWVMPSPNIPTIDAVRVYPGTCFIEGSTLSEGRGTAKPFETFGAPYVDADDLADTMNALELPGARWRPAHFIPTASKHNGVPCHGCQLHVLDPEVFRPVTAGVHLLCVLRNQYPEAFEWLPPFSEGRPPFIDLLAGSDALRLAVDAGVPAEDILSGWATERQIFLNAQGDCLLYH